MIIKQRGQTVLKFYSYSHIFEPTHSLLMSSLYIMVTHPFILLIEDSPGECELFRLTLTQTRPLLCSIPSTTRRRRSA